jgi:hypothetical protein
MSYKWKPSKTARREFAQKMQNDVDFANAYNERKVQKAEKRRSTSQFDYEKAGGYYIPTKIQYDFAMSYDANGSAYIQDALSQVISGYSLQSKIHHDNIHIINELMRKNNSNFAL